MDNKYKLTLHGYHLSSATWRVRNVLKFRSIPFENIQVDIFNGEHETEEYKKMNPNARVPCLQVTDLASNKTHFMSESFAICDFLELAYPEAENKLIPSDLVLRQKVLEVCNVINAAIQPMQNAMVLRVLKNEFGVEDAAPFAAKYVQKGLEAVSQIINEDGTNEGKNFCFGDTPYLCDMFLLPQMAGARRFKLQIEGTPLELLSKIEINLLDRYPSLVEAKPEFWK